MRNPIGVPFALSALVTAAVALPALHFRDVKRFEPRAGAAPAAAGAAFVDARVDVPHAGDGVRAALRTSLQWLARHQYAEGMWSARSFAQLCEGRVCDGRGGDEHDLGVTALAVLALLESGELRRHEDSVRRGLAWLAGRQDIDGCFGPRAGKWMYGHAIATLAFARAHPLLGEAIYKHHAARGVRFLEMARNPGLAWRYGMRDGENDTSVTAWAGAALVAAASPDVGLRVDPYAFDGIRRWLAEVTGERHLEASYVRRGGGSASVPGFEKNEGLTAMALGLRLQLGAGRDQPEVRGAARRLGWSLPCWNAAGTSADFAYWYAGTRALAAYGDADLWQAWSGRARRALLGSQRKFNEACAGGSWDPVDKWGSEGGRIYATAMNALTLSVLDHGRQAQAPAPSQWSRQTPPVSTKQ